MATKKNFFKQSNLISALLYIVVGILFCIFKGAVAVWTVYVLAALLIVQGVLDMINKRLLQGILEAAVGVLAIVFAASITKIAAAILGVIIFLWAFKRLIDNGHKSVMDLLVILGAGVLGVLLIVNAFLVLDWFFIVIGVLLIVEGILYLVPAN